MVSLPSGSVDVRASCRSDLVLLASGVFFGIAFLDVSFVEGFLVLHWLYSQLIYCIFLCGS
jgi:hypothetical protein